MRQLTSIVARSSDSAAIGVDNRLPWKIRTDLKFFREQTLDCVVVMGRKTHHSLGGCLPRRKNIVVSHDPAPFATHEDCKCVSSIEEALHAAYISSGSEDSGFVVGGAMMYEQFAPFVDRYLITEVDKIVDDADTFFDERNFINSVQWKRSLLHEGTANQTGDECDFRIYEYRAIDADKIAARRNEAIKRLTDRGRRSASVRSPRPRIMCI